MHRFKTLYTLCYLLVSCSAFHMHYSYADEMATTNQINQINQVNQTNLPPLSAPAIIQNNTELKKISITDWEKFSKQAPFNQRAISLGEASELQDTPLIKANQSSSSIELHPFAGNTNPIKNNMILDENNLWQRIRQGFKMNTLNSELVENRRNWYLARPDYFMRINERAKKYLYHIVEELEKRKMPTELALLPIIESAFNPTAHSSAKAAGIWQFMPKTGRYFNLSQSAFVDERRDVLQSTQAALDYLQKLYGMFGDWHLALAAYNWGEGSVMRALQRNQNQGLPADYLSLNMPDETRYYVPKLMAVRDIIESPEKYQATLPSIPNHPYFIQIPIKRDIDVAQILNLSGLSMMEFLALNPAYKKPVIAAANSPQILLPWEQGQKVAKTLEELYEKNINLSSYSAIKLSQRERIESIAKRFNTSSDLIRELNKVNKGMRFGAGSVVLVPKTGSTPAMISETIISTGQIKTEKDLPDTRRIFVRAGRYDQIEKIANRYNVSVDALKSWNSFEKGLRPLQIVALVLPYHASFNINPNPPKEVMLKPKPFIKIVYQKNEEDKRPAKKILAFAHVNNVKHLKNTKNADEDKPNKLNKINKVNKNKQLQADKGEKNKKT